MGAMTRGPAGLARVSGGGGSRRGRPRAGKGGWATEVCFHVGRPASGFRCTGFLENARGLAGCEIESVGDGRGGRYELYARDDASGTESEAGDDEVEAEGKVEAEEEEEAEGEQKGGDVEKTTNETKNNGQHQSNHGS